MKMLLRKLMKYGKIYYNFRGVGVYPIVNVTVKDIKEEL